MANVFFISDLHFSHTKLLGFRSEVHKKLFPTIEHMDEWIIEGWNSVVGKRDLVWVLGDVAWTYRGLAKMKQLNGMKNLVMGNHDNQHHHGSLRQFFNKIVAYEKRYGFVMSHVPIHTNELNYRWNHNVHGHIHHVDKDLNDERYTNVNIDIIGNVPIPLDAMKVYVGRGDG